MTSCEGGLVFILTAQISQLKGTVVGFLFHSAQIVIVNVHLVLCVKEITSCIEMKLTNFACYLMNYCTGMSEDPNPILFVYL